MSENQFKVAYDQKREALRGIERMIDHLRDDMKRDAERKINLFLDSCHGAALREARDEARKATNEFWADRVARHKTGEGAQFALGSLLRKGRRGSWPNNKIVAYEYGIYEVYEPGAPLPENSAWYSRPDQGDYILRICKKDGSPGIKIEKGNLYGWELTPENERPWK